MMYILNLCTCTCIRYGSICTHVHVHYYDDVYIKCMYVCTCTYGSICTHVHVHYYDKYMMYMYVHVLDMDLCTHVHVSFFLSFFLHL